MKHKRWTVTSSLWRSPTRSGSAGKFDGLDHYIVLENIMDWLKIWHFVNTKHGRKLLKVSSKTPASVPSNTSGDDPTSFRAGFVYHNRGWWRHNLQWHNVQQVCLCFLCVTFCGTLWRQHSWWDNLLQVCEIPAMRWVGGNRQMLWQMFHRTTSETLRYVAVNQLVIVTELTPEPCSMFALRPVVSWSDTQSKEWS